MWPERPERSLYLRNLLLFLFFEEFCSICLIISSFIRVRLLKIIINSWILYKCLCLSSSGRRALFLAWSCTTPHICLKTGEILMNVSSLACVSWFHPLFPSNPIPLTLPAQVLYNPLYSSRDKARFHFFFSKTI